jgi:hypothetical protein
MGGIRRPGISTSCSSTLYVCKRSASIDICRSGGGSGGLRLLVIEQRPSKRLMEDTTLGTRGTNGSTIR